MSQWIIGGFFAVAIIALLGAVFLGLSERTPIIKPSSAKTTSDSQDNKATDENDASKDLASQPQEIEHEQPPEVVESETAQQEEQRIQELRTGIHDLHEQATYMTQRISTIVEIAKNFEQKREDSEEHSE